MTFTHIYAVGVNVGGNYKNRLLVLAYTQSFPLADSVELRTLMADDALAPGILLVARLLDMVLAGAVGLRLEADVGIVDGRREFLPFLLGEGGPFRRQLLVAAVLIPLASENGSSSTTSTTTASSSSRTATGNGMRTTSVSTSS
jgi:hypothetical protein